MSACFPNDETIKCFIKERGIILDLVNLIYRNMPVIPRVLSEKEELHSFIIVGYSLKKEFFIYHESQGNPFQKISFDEFMRIWTFTNNRYLYCKKII